MALLWLLFILIIATNGFQFCFHWYLNYDFFFVIINLFLNMSQNIQMYLYVSALYWNEKRLLPFPLSFTSCLCASLYTVCWAFDPCSQYKVCSMCLFKIHITISLFPYNIHFPRMSIFILFGNF